MLLYHIVIIFNRLYLYICLYTYLYIYTYLYLYIYIYIMTRGAVWGGRLGTKTFERKNGKANPCMDITCAVQCSIFPFLSHQKNKLQYDRDSDSELQPEGFLATLWMHRAQMHHRVQQVALARSLIWVLPQVAPFEGSSPGPPITSSSLHGVCSIWT